MKSFVVAMVAAACLVVTYEAVPAQTVDPNALKQRTQQRTSREQYRERINENVIYLMGGQLGAGYSLIAHDIATVVNQGDALRVLPVSGGAGVQNVRDVAFLRGIDLGVTNVLTLNHLKSTGELGNNLDQQIAFITPLFPDVLQVVVRGDFNQIEDLRGKKIAFNNKGSSTATFSPIVFKTLGIEVEEHFMAQGDALSKMRSGEIDATVCSCPIPLPAYLGIKPEWGFKLLPVPYVQALEENYYPAKIKPEDYANLNLVPKDSAGIDTIASSSVLVTFNWAPNTARYARIAKFVDAMFTRFEDFRKPPRHPLWKSVNLAGKVPGWQRFPAAQEWIDRFEKEDRSALRTSFVQFMAGKRAATDEGAAAEQERLFREFLEWRTQANRNQ